jgi:AcrR family transcriptional regulator
MPSTAIQRRRILDAMTVVCSEHGFARASVSSLCGRAKVSRRTFYEAFDALEDCFLAVLDDGARRASVVISRAFDGERQWLDGVRGALAALLVLFDSEPALAHVLLVEASAAGSWARERREQHVAAVTSLIEDRWAAPRDGQAHPLVTAGVMASLLGVLHTHLVTAREEPLISLLGPAMGLVTAPYLDQRGVTREIRAAETLARELLARPGSGQLEHTHGDVEVPDLLLDSRAHRARTCLLHVVAHPGVSNRQLARALGIASDSHISTLLARLHRAGVLVKARGAPGGPNAWSASPYGQRVAHALAPSPGTEATAARHA